MWRRCKRGGFIDPALLRALEPDCSVHGVVNGRPDEDHDLAIVHTMRCSARAAASVGILVLFREVERDCARTILILACCC